MPTSITIGYDAPWRQVQALLLLAAARTPGVRRTPAPIVHQSSLEDFYVKYTLLFCLEQSGGAAQGAGRRARQHPRRLQRVRRADHVAQLRGRSGEPKVVPRDQWFAAPAAVPANDAQKRARHARAQALRPRPQSVTGPSNQSGVLLTTCGEPAGRGRPAGSRWYSPVMNRSRSCTTLAGCIRAYC